MNTTAKIYTAFSSAGLFRSTGTYLLHDPDEKVLSNEEMLSEIRRRCEGVEFVGTTEVEKPEYTVANVQARRRSLDGLLYFGSLPAGLTRFGLPTMAVYPLWGQWQEPFHSYKGDRVLTATLPVIPDSSDSVFSARLEAIAEKIRLLQVVLQRDFTKVRQQAILKQLSLSDRQLAITTAARHGIIVPATSRHR